MDGGREGLEGKGERKRGPAGRGGRGREGNVIGVHPLLSLLETQKRN
jgi:hypothetical protein